MSCMGTHPPGRCSMKTSGQLREQTLRAWFQRTIGGPFDDGYWEWQNFVGLVHVKRGANNAMLADMWGWPMNYLGKRAMQELESQEALRLIKAVHLYLALIKTLGVRLGLLLPIDWIFKQNRPWKIKKNGTEGGT